MFDEVGYKDEHSLYIIYELDKREEWEKPDCWEKANPGLGTIKNRNALASKVKKAQANPSLVRNLVCKEFNIAETSTESWLNFDELNNETKFDVKELRPTYGIGGADLSSTTDLTAAKMLFRVPDNENIFVLSMYWIPADLVEKK